MVEASSGMDEKSCKLYERKSRLFVILTCIRWLTRDATKELRVQLGSDQTEPTEMVGLVRF